LKRTLEKANEACNYISQVAWDTHTFGKFQVQKLVYEDVRKTFDLTAQLVIRCIAKVTDAYKLDKKIQREFKPLGAIAYDQRILNWYTEKQFVSIWTVDGREKIPFVGGPRQLELLKHQKGESDLCFVDGEFYLLTTCEIEDLEPADVQDFLGIDMGEKNIATTSDGDIQTSELVEQKRKRHQRLRNELQSKGTKSSRRRLKALRRQQARFQKDVNHQISKRLVATAKHTQRGIGLEDLTGITTRTRVRGKDRRAQRSNWSFAQLRTFIEYKARLIGVPFVAVDPAYTSQRCFACGHIEASNRRSQSEFLCQSCGYTAHADVNAAKNIAGLASYSLMSQVQPSFRL
jgi:IS605 OrfB family transposase